MKEDLKELMTVDGLAEAEIINSKLESVDIPALLRYEGITKLCGITTDGIGKVKILVHAADLKKAKEILKVE